MAVYTSRSFGISSVLHFTYNRCCGPLSLSVSHLLPSSYVLILRFAVLVRGSKGESVGTGRTGTGTRLHGDGWKDEWKNKEARGSGGTAQNAKMLDLIERWSFVTEGG